jgi:GT2 family glycosyltransferase/polysaccharide pyruvyl transferase WcaK-like protein
VASPLSPSAFLASMAAVASGKPSRSDGGKNMATRIVFINVGDPDETNSMTIAHFGTFDVDNYGDCLFPLLLERRTAEAGFKSVHVSPRGIATRWPDSARTISLEEASASADQFTSVVLGGGHIVRAHPTSLDFYNYSNVSGHLVYPSLWLSASALAHRSNIPLCWNAPGVPRPLSGRFSKLLQWGLSRSRYLAVRDRRSCEHLLASGVSLHIHVVPDTALEVRHLWSKAELDLAYRTLFGEQSCLVPERSVVFNLKKKYISGNVDELAQCLDRIATFLRASPILLALGPCHGDEDISLAVARKMTTSPMVRTPRSLSEVVACISQAELYAGSSLHGAITAASFRTPSIVIANEEKVGFRKFSGFLAQVGIPDALSCSWENAERHIYLGMERQWHYSRLEQAFAVLDDHWTSLCSALTLRRGQSGDDSQAYRTSSLVDEADDRSDPRPEAGIFGTECAVCGTQAEEVGSSHRDRAKPIIEWIRERCLPTLDVIICVHNALGDVQRCLNSLLNYTTIPYKLHLINDGSDAATSMYLSEFASKYGSVLLTNDSQVGYTKAANTGLRNSCGEFVLLLNSDTIVSSRWLEKLLECACIDDKIGIVGPLSNAAAYQSVPFTKNEKHQWVTNTLPAGLSPALADAIVERLSRREFPRVPFLNGFCLLLKREVISKIGYFDEEAFPLGYGEEIDFCLRAGKAGLELAVADHAYVFHVKSASYGHGRRRTLSLLARAQLDAKHGAATLSAARTSLNGNECLASIRRHIAAAFAGYSTQRQGHLQLNGEQGIPSEL